MLPYINNYWFTQYIYRQLLCSSIKYITNLYYASCSTWSTTCVVYTIWLLCFQSSSKEIPCTDEFTAIWGKYREVTRMTWSAWNLIPLNSMVPSWKAKISSQACWVFNWIIPSGGTWQLWSSFLHLLGSSSSPSSSSRRKLHLIFEHFTQREL